MNKEAKQGRPYVPWASRPYDLRQARIPAFPGAEGGGMYTFGGRGGKVLTEYKAWKPYTDSDLDGMPDEWETAHDLNPNDPTDANGDLNGDGYTNIEKYINGIGSDNYNQK